MLAAVAVVAVLAVIAPACASPGRADLLQAIQKEDANIDKFLFGILKLQKLQEVPRWDQRPRRQPNHPPRLFAYYPTDPEYSAPRPSQGQGAFVTGADTTYKQPPATSASYQPERQPAHVAPVPTEPHDDGDIGTAPPGQEEQAAVNTGREKRPIGSIHLAGRIEALRGLRPQRDKLADIYFIGGEHRRRLSQMWHFQAMKLLVQIMTPCSYSNLIPVTAKIYGVRRCNVTVVGVCVGTICVTILGGICYRYLQRDRRRSSSELGCPSYGVTGPRAPELGSTGGDRKLAQSAQLYHYQRQKQQMMAIEEGKTMDQRSSPSDEDSDDENEESEHTVYECPGLAPSGEMEVKNPLFNDDPTPCQSLDDSDGR